MARPLPHPNASYLLIFGLVTACFLIPTALAEAATLYVAPDGDDSNPGTIDRPWATVWHAGRGAKAGDTVYFRGGIYYAQRQSTGWPKGTDESERTLFRNYPGEVVIWDGNDVYNPFYLNGAYITIENIEVRNCRGYGLECAGPHITIRNCVIHTEAMADMVKFLACAPHGIVEHCEFYGTSGDQNMIDAFGDDLIVRHNYFHDHDGGEQTVLVKGGASRAAIYCNLFVNVQEIDKHSAAICLGGATGEQYMHGDWECIDSVAFNNVVVGCGGAGIIFWDAKGCAAYNNTFVGLHGRYGVKVLCYDLEEMTQDTTFKNNIVVCEGSAHKALIQVHPDAMTGLDLDHNLFCCVDDEEYIVWDGLYDQYSLRVSFADYQSQFGQDVNSLSTDPLFVGAGDYHLTIDSLAIDAGVYELGVPSDDFDGNPRPYGDAIDIGAYEYMGAGGGNEAPVLAWAGETGYESDGLEPETGTAATDFTWKIEYSDPDSDAPYGVYLHVLEDGTELGDSPYDMTSEGGDDWSAGVVFAKMLNLPKGSDYTYYFSAADEHGAQTSYPATPLAGPQVNNSPPTAPSVAISPESPTDQDELQATAEGSTDIDEGDETSYELQWYCDDLLQEDLTEATVLATRTSVGEVWRCEVVATDGQDDSEAGSAEVTVTAAYSISGTILDTESNPVADVNVTAGDDSATTGTDGTYMIQGLPAGTFTATPSLAEYGFDPGSQDVTVNETQGDASAVDFTASQEIYSISGIVTSGGSGLQGVQVAANGHSTATAADGTYIIGGLIAGTYTVTLVLAGYGFAPESVEISVGSGEGSATGVDFVGGSIFTLTVPAGLSLLGVPCTPLGDNSPGSLFGDAAVVRWDPIALQYVASDPGAGPATAEFLGVAPSKGYFVYTSEAQELRIAGEPAGTAAPFAGVGLSPGWNMVANPFCEELPFANFLTHTTNIRPYAFSYDWEANSYRVVIADGAMAVGRTSLLPWEGIWVCAVESGTLTVEPPMGTSAQAAQRQEEPQHDGWTIPIAARAAGRADLSSLAGVTGTEVSWQIYNPPSVPDSVDVYLVGSGDRPLAHDLRPGTSGSFSWDFVVSTDIRDAEVAVSLPDLSQVPADLSLILEDRDASRTMYARTMTSYAFRSNNYGPTERHFRLSVAPRNDRGLVISTASVHPAGAAVRLAYSSGPGGDERAHLGPAQPKRKPGTRRPLPGIN